MEGSESEGREPGKDVCEQSTNQGNGLERRAELLEDSGEQTSH